MNETLRHKKESALIERACPEHVREALQTLAIGGKAAYAVGGCIRDCLLGKPPHDWDIASSASPDEVRELFSDSPVLTTGAAHGTVTVLLQGMPLEITTFRMDGPYSDRRRPDYVTFAARIEEDLARRDFTINAMAWNPQTGLIDCFGGLTDLKRGVLRCVGDPARRFGEDALRILRALRFCSRFSFSIEPKTASSIRKNKGLLSRVAAERITNELLNLLTGENVQAVLLDFPEVFLQILPELAPCVTQAQNTPYHLYNVYEHTARGVAAVKPDPVMRLAMLLHDIGKPARHFATEDGRDHFKGHPYVSARMAKGIFYRMRLDRKSSHRALLLIQWHDAAIREDRVCIRRWFGLLGPALFFDLLEIKRADNLSKNVTVADARPHLDALERLARQILADSDCYSLDTLDVSGNDLLKAGLAQGKMLGAALTLLLEKAVSGECPNKKDALIACLRANPPIPPPEFPKKPLFTFRKADASDLEKAAAFYFEINRRLEQGPINPVGWRNNFYPTRETVEEAIASSTLWLMEANGLLAGGVVLNHKQAEVYKNGDWSVKARAEEVLVVHTLAVHPACSGRGAGKRLMKFVLEEGRKNGAKTVRLDAFTGNPAANALYEGGGFRYCGTVDLGLDVPGLKWFRLYEYVF